MFPDIGNNQLIFIFFSVCERGVGGVQPPSLDLELAVLHPILSNLFSCFGCSWLQELRNDVDEAGIRIWEHERKLELLNQKKRTIEQGMCDLQGSYFSHIFTFGLLLIANGCFLHAFT